MAKDWAVTEPTTNHFQLFSPDGTQAGEGPAEDIIDEMTDAFTAGDVDEFTAFKMPDGTTLDLDDAIDWLDGRS